MGQRISVRKDRVNQSFESRAELIATLEAVLAATDDTIPADRVTKLRMRIAELKRRQDNPGSSLYLGLRLYRKYANNGEIASGAW